MIEQFKDNEIRSSGLIFSSVLEQIKELHQYDPDQAGELAISAIELVLTGDISSDDVNVKIMLAPLRKINEVNVAKYETKIENKRQKKIVEMKLDKIAEMTNQGFKQREIGERLGLSQQVVSYRVDVIKKNYPELLQENSTKIQTNSTNSLQENKNTRKQNFVQVCTKEENFVQNSVEETGESEEKLSAEEARKMAFNFWFLQTFYKQSRFLQKNLQIVQTEYKITNNTNTNDNVNDNVNDKWVRFVCPLRGLTKSLCALRAINDSRDGLIEFVGQ